MTYAKTAATTYQRNAVLNATPEKLVKLLYDNDYAGWLVVEAEQDPVVAPSYRYAEKGYRHLRALVERAPFDAAQEAA